MMLLMRNGPHDGSEIEVRKLLALLAISASVLIAGVTANEAKAGGQTAWACVATTSYGYQRTINCSVSAYQYGDGAFRNIFNGYRDVGSFWAPYSGTVTVYATACGSTKSQGVAPGGRANFYWTNC